VSLSPLPRTPTSRTLRSGATHERKDSRPSAMRRGERRDEARDEPGATRLRAASVKMAAGGVCVCALLKAAFVRMHARSRSCSRPALPRAQMPHGGRAQRAHRRRCLRCVCAAGGLCGAAVGALAALILLQVASCGGANADARRGSMLPRPPMLAPTALPRARRRPAHTGVARGLREREDLFSAGMLRLKGGAAGARAPSSGRGGGGGGGGGGVRADAPRKGDVMVRRRVWKKASGWRPVKSTVPPPSDWQHLPPPHR